MDLCLSRQSGQTLQVAILYDNPEMLLDFKKQLSWLPGVALSIFILESITENENPEGLLSSFDLIITPSKHLEAISGLLPNLSGRVMEAAISPCHETLIQITSLPRDSRIGIICRTNVFLAAVKDILLSFGFWEDRIQSFFEMDYTTKTYFPGGIDVLISFADAHIFTNPEFEFRNEEFLAKGGRIIAFHHQIEKGTLIIIQNRVGELLNHKRTS